MALNSTEKQNLFAEFIPISVKDVYTNQTRTRHLFLTMEWQDSSPTMYSRKVLVLSLTDNDDPFFLYNLYLSEEDFQMLKASQDLLINFHSFPQHIIDYIENCVLEEKNPQPKFVLVFTMNEKLGSAATPSQLDIIETNQFKNLTHLSLKFIAATETAVRQYLTSSFRSLKEEKRLLNDKLSFLEQDARDKLAALQSRLSSKEEELDILKKKNNVELSEKDAQHSLNLQKEMNQLILKHKEDKDRLENVRKEEEYNYRKQIEQLESRVTSLNSLNKELEDKNLKHKSSIKDQSSKIETLENEVRKLNDKIQILERKSEKLKTEQRGKESYIHHLEETLCAVKKELESRTSEIKVQEDKIENNVREVENLKKELEDLNLQIEMKERHQKMNEEEKESLNKIIMKLQDKVEQAKKTHGLFAKCKAAVEEKDKLLSDLKKETAELSINLEAKNAEVKKLNGIIHFCNQKIGTLMDDLTSKQNVIKFLNSELTKNCIIPQYGPPQSLKISPSSVAQKELGKIDSAAHRKSVGSDNTSLSLTAVNNPDQKSMRLDRSTPPTGRNNFSTSARFHTTDSAYCTSPSGFTHEMTTEVLPLDFGNENVEIDHRVLSAAFGEGDILKHSTAKKVIKPARSISAKHTKKL